VSKRPIERNIKQNQLPIIHIYTYRHTICSSILVLAYGSRPFKFICESPNYLNGPGNLFDQFSVVLSFIALISGCFQAPIWVAQPLFLLLFYFLVQITRWFHDFINECSPIISNKRHYKDKEPIG
jgi:hypothetical protein